MLCFNLEVEGYSVDTATSTEETLAMPLKTYDWVILDVMMGNISGFRMAQRMKEDPATRSVPIVFCTAKSTEDDIVAGLNLGADDYVVKPYTIRQMLARVRSVLRRTSPMMPAEEPTELISFDTLVIDTKAKLLTINGE